MSTSNRATDDTVKICGTAHVCPQSITANDMWLKNRSVPSDYLDSVLGSAGVTVVVRAIPADKLTNGAKSK